MILQLLSRAFFKRLICLGDQFKKLFLEHFWDVLSNKPSSWQEFRQTLKLFRQKEKQFCQTNLSRERNSVNFWQNHNSNRTFTTYDRISTNFDRTIFAIFWQNHNSNRTFTKIRVWQNSKWVNVLSEKCPLRNSLSYLVISSWGRPLFVTIND